jgi:cohesin complex subunit SA-1/2
MIKAIHTNKVLFSNIELIENIQIWLSTMSAAQNRPFRHTATVVSLAIVTALCEVGSGLADEASRALRHSETQRKGKNANKTRVSELQANSKTAKANQEVLDNTVKDWFDTIYIHRYRDVDPHIRVDCARALGDWIVAYPDVFFDGSHLRYLGWVLSDTNHSTRLEVIKQLHRLYADKNKLGGLKTFTEKFRGRMVEMATRDAESSVRAASVELLDDLREGGLLEPDDIDAIGRLIFDAEPRVRKSVVGFFAESINDAYEAKVDNLGGQEALEEIIGEEHDSPDNPSPEWIKFKCLAEGLDSYDSADGTLPLNAERVAGHDN